MQDPRHAKITHKPALAEQLGNARVSHLQRYRQKVTGTVGLPTLLYYELASMICSNMAGGIGYLLRKKLLGPLFKNAGPGIILGRGISIRHPRRIILGFGVAIDDYVLLDAGAAEEGIVLGDRVIVSRNCVIQSKIGMVRVGARSDIGCNTVLTSASGIQIGRDVLVAGNCYLGGAQYVTERLDIAIMDQGLFTKEPLRVGDGTWLGAGVTVLDGVSIGRGCIIGAGAVVTKDLADYVVAVGVPAKALYHRGEMKSAPILPEADEA